jgi:hypothetical protein
VALTESTDWTTIIYGFAVSHTEASSRSVKSIPDDMTDA